MAIILPTITVPNLPLPSLPLPSLPTLPTLPTLPISTTMISCVSNPLMIGLNVVKGALSDNLDGLASGGKDRLAALKKTGEDIKGKLKTMILLELPAIPNFKTEYAMLLASINNRVDFVKNALALEKKWGKAIGIAVIRGLLDDIGKIDLCKGIPNIDGKPQPDGTVTAIPKAQPAPIPAAPPAAPVPVPPTVQSATVKPSSGQSGISQEVYNDFLKYENNTTILDVLHDMVKPHAAKFDEIKKTNLYIKLMEKVAKSEAGGLEEYSKTNALTDAENDLGNTLHDTVTTINSLAVVYFKLKVYRSYSFKVVAGMYKDSEKDYYYSLLANNYEKLTIVTVTNGKSVRDTTTGKNALLKLKASADENKDLITKGLLYRQNRAPI